MEEKLGKRQKKKNGTAFNFDKKLKLNCLAYINFHSGYKVEFFLNCMNFGAFKSHLSSTQNYMSDCSLEKGFDFFKFSNQD